MTIELKPPLFGSPLVTALARHTSTSRSGHIIPGLLLRLYEEIQKRGLSVQGIFRRSGSTTDIGSLQALFEAKDNPFDVDLSHASIHSLTGLFKRFLHQLPEPVIPRACQRSFLQSYDEMMSTETCVERIKAAILSLPRDHSHLLLFLIYVAEQVYQHEEKNQMSREALAIIFAPTCVQVDAVTQLMQYSTLSSTNTTANVSTISLPEAQPTLKKARQMLWSAIRKKPLPSGRSRNPSPLYQPQNLMDLELIKESGRWTRLFEFMFSHAHELNPASFTTEPAVSNHYPTSNISQSLSLFSSDTNQVENIEPGVVDQKLNMDTLEFPESIEIARKFDAFHLELEKQHQTNWPSEILPYSQRRQPLRSSSVRLSPTFSSWFQSRKGTILLNTGTKYSNVLRSWKAREQQQQEQAVQQQQEQLCFRQQIYQPEHEQQLQLQLQLQQLQLQPNMPSVVLQKGLGPSRLQIRSPHSSSLDQPTSDWIKVLSKNANGIQAKQEPIASLHRNSETVGVREATLD